MFVAYVNLPRNGGSPEAARARFTLAHETGHYFVDEHRHALRSGQPPHGSATDFASHLRVEVEADLFAAHLLMPAARVRKRLRRTELGLPGVLSLADSFGTSRTSMAVRAAQLDLWPWRSRPLAARRDVVGQRIPSSPALWASTDPSRPARCPVAAPPTSSAAPVARTHRSRPALPPATGSSGSVLGDPEMSSSEKRPSASVRTER